MQHRRIILLIEDTSAYGRACLRGIARYARVQGGWAFYHGMHALTEPLRQAEMRRWKADGVLARVENRHIAKVVRELRLPAVDLRGSIPIPRVARITTDDLKVVSMAADHLRSNGIQHLAYCGYPGIDFSDARQEVFVNAIHVHPGVKAVFDPTADGREVPEGSYRQRGQIDSPALQMWLKQLPKPIGVIACNDTRGRQILDACAAAGIRVPYDVAVVGVDDDDVLCELSYPTLSSVSPNAEMIGFDAAGILDRMIGGAPPPEDVILFPPLALEVRGSSDVMAISDPTLAEAVRIIREQAGTGLTVKDLLDRLCVSRSTLERQFNAQLGCTPHDYIARCRVQRLKQLLVDTRYTLGEITRLSGFCSVAHMTAFFRLQTGQTPGQYRRGQG